MPYTDFHQMLVREDLDLAVVCVPAALHAPVTEQVAERGVHILVEKPLSVSYRGVSGWSSIVVTTTMSSCY